MPGGPLTEDERGRLDGFAQAVYEDASTLQLLRMTLDGQDRAVVCRVVLEDSGSFFITPLYLHLTPDEVRRLAAEQQEELIEAPGGGGVLDRPPIPPTLPMQQRRPD